MSTSQEKPASWTKLVDWLIFTVEYRNSVSLAGHE